MIDKEDKNPWENTKKETPQELLSKELYTKAQASLAQFCYDIKELIHKGTYTLKNLNRSFDDSKISSAIMEIGDFRVFFRADEWEVMMPVEGNPVNEDLLEYWEKQHIDWELNYHQEMLEKLSKRKEELNSKDNGN